MTAAIAFAAYFAAGRILQATDNPTQPYPVWFFLAVGAVFGVIVGKWWALLLPVVWLFLAAYAGPSLSGHDDTGLVIWSAIYLAPFEAAAIGLGLGVRQVLRRLISRPSGDLGGLP